MNVLYPCLLALMGTGFTYAMTTLGSATVFLMKNTKSRKMQDLFLGFASGVMMAASIWSLLLPALQQAENQGIIPWIPAACGFLLGSFFFFILDITLPHLNAAHDQPHSLKGTTKLLAAITLHNIPEGMAVGLAFALALQPNSSGTNMATAIALAIGIGIQNFPEGAAVALPMCQEGKTKRQAFWYGSLSGVVEPIGGVLTVLIASTVQVLMPWLLSFAAGTMIYVIVDELIPDAHKQVNSNMGTMGAIMGFLVMMMLDVILG